MQKYIKLKLNDQDLSTAYLDSGNESLPVALFIHGNSSNKDSFLPQLKRMSSLYRVISVDLPGHGESENLIDQEYSLDLLGHFIMKFVDSLDLQIDLLMGHSLGGHISLQILNRLSPNKLAVWGTSPMSNPPVLEEMFLPCESSAVLFKEEFTEEEVAQLYNDCFVQGDSLLQKNFIKSFENTDPLFRSQLMKNLGTLNFKDEIQEIKTFEGRSIFLNGDQEKIVNKSYMNKFLPELRHVQVIETAHYPHLESPIDFNLELLKNLTPMESVTNHETRIRNI